MPPNCTTFDIPCKFCGQPILSITSTGLVACRLCDIAIGICGPKPADLPAENYKAVIVELAALAQLLPQGDKEKWPAYKTRIALMRDEQLKRRPIPDWLRAPLPPSAVNAAMEGLALHQVLAAAAPPKVVAVKPLKPLVKKKTDGTPVKTKISEV
jgi:hypothetical protein